MLDNQQQEFTGEEPKTNVDQGSTTNDAQEQENEQSTDNKSRDDAIEQLIEEGPEGEEQEGSVQATRKSRTVRDSAGKAHVLTITNDNDPDTPEKAMIDGITVATFNLADGVSLDAALIDVQNRFAKESAVDKIAGNSEEALEKATDKAVNKIEDAAGAEKLLNDEVDLAEFQRRLDEAEKKGAPEEELEAIRNELVDAVEAAGKENGVSGQDLLGDDIKDLGTVTPRTAALAEESNEVSAVRGA